MKQKHIAAQYIDEQERVCWMTSTIFAKMIPKTEESLENWTMLR